MQEGTNEKKGELGRCSLQFFMSRVQIFDSQEVRLEVSKEYCAVQPRLLMFGLAIRCPCMCLIMDFGPWYCRWSQAQT